MTLKFTHLPVPKDKEIDMAAYTITRQFLKGRKSLTEREDGSWAGIAQLPRRRKKPSSFYRQSAAPVVNTTIVNKKAQNKSFFGRVKSFFSRKV